MGSRCLYSLSIRMGLPQAPKWFPVFRRSRRANFLPDVRWPAAPHFFTSFLLVHCFQFFTSFSLIQPPSFLPVVCWSAPPVFYQFFTRAPWFRKPVNKSQVFQVFQFLTSRKSESEKLEKNCLAVFPWNYTTSKWNYTIYKCQRFDVFGQLQTNSFKYAHVYRFLHWIPWNNQKK